MGTALYPGPPAPACWAARAFCFVRRRLLPIQKAKRPTATTTTMGPITAPAIQALEVEEPPFTGSGVVEEVEMGMVEATEVGMEEVLEVAGS